MTKLPSLPQAAALLAALAVALSLSACNRVGSDAAPGSGTSGPTGSSSTPLPSVPAGAGAASPGGDSGAASSGAAGTVPAGAR